MIISIETDVNTGWSKKWTLEGCIPVCDYVERQSIPYIKLLTSLSGRGGLVVGRRTCDLRVAGSRPGRDAAAQQP